MSIPTSSDASDGVKTIPTRFWTANFFAVSDVKSKITGKETVHSNTFRCLNDPHSPVFRVLLYFGTKKDGWLSMYIQSIGQVKLTMMKSSIFDDKGTLLMAKTWVVPCLIPTDKDIGLTEHAKLTSLGNSETWRLILDLEYEATSPADAAPSVDSGNSCINDFLKMLETPQNADVTFRLRNDKIMAHKAILVARSSYFEAMFDSRWREAASNDVEVPDVEPRVFKGLLQYIYSGLPPKDLSTIAMDLLAVADEYNIMNLKKMCESSVRASLGAETVVDALLLADQYHCEDLMTHAKVVFRDNIGAVKKSKENWEKLAAYPMLLLKLLEESYNTPITFSQRLNLA